MPSNTTATTTVGGLNIQVERGIRDVRLVSNGDTMEWPELAGLEVGRQIEKLNEMLQVESKIRDGAELMLEVRTKEPLRRQVESQLEAAKSKIQAIQKKIDQLREQSLPSSTTRTGPTPSRANKRKATAGFLNGAGLLPTPASSSVNASTPNSAATSPVPTPNGTLNTDGSQSQSSADPSGLKRLGRGRNEGDTSENREDYKTALSQASGLSRALASIVSPESKGINGMSGDVSPPAGTSNARSYVLVDPSNEAEVEKARMELMTSLVQVLSRNKRVGWEINVRELVRGIIPSLSDNASVPLRTAAFRLLRYAMLHPNGPELFSDFEGKDLGWFVARSLARDNKHLAEKEQVFLLIRALIDIGSTGRAPNVSAGCSSIPIRENVVRALVSIAEHEEDTNALRWPAVEMLAEILLLDTELLYRSEGIRVLLQTLADGPPEFGPVLANVFLTIIDNPRTREFLKLETDLEMAISGITDAYGRGESHLEAMKSSAKVVVTLLRSWAGLMYLCTNDMLAIRAIVDTLRVPTTDTREVVLDMLFEVLNIKPAEWYRAFLDGRRLTMYGRQKHDTTHQSESIEVAVETDRLTLVDQYLALVLAVLTEAGLLEALICMVEELPASGSNLARKAVLLLGEALQAANRLLPLTYAAKIQSLPKLFSLASDFNLGQNRMIGTSTLSSIDSFNRNRSRLQPVQAKTSSRNRANSTDDPMRRGQRQIEQVKLKMAMQLDDRAFQMMLAETQVMQTKDHTKWSYEILVDLFEGPFLGAKRIEEGFRTSKFGKRLMAFWHPSARRFSDLSKTRANQRWIKLGCLILSTLLKTQEGTKFLLNEDDFLKDLAESFAQFDPRNGNPAYDSILTKTKLEATCSSGYLQMLGQLSKTPRGIELMEHFKFFNSFYHLSDLKFREDLIKEIVENLDYTVDGHSRIVLSKALTSSYKHIRLYSTEYLGNLILNSKQSNAWTLRLLLTQLYDPAMEVRELAVNFLEEACENQEVLRLVVDMQPTLDHLGELGHPLLLRFMSTAAGFRYLFETEYIEREMNAWFHERNQQYVVLVEVYLAKAFSTDPADEDDEMLAFDGLAPPHFYGEMVKTEQGCRVLAEKGHFNDFTHFIRQHGHDSEDSDIILKLKSVLWAVGNIGASERGISFLEEDDIIPYILEMAELSPVLSVRGTCFFVIGLIASTEQGADILADFGWSAAIGPLGNPTGVCIPDDIGKLMALQAWETPSLSEGDRRLPPLKSQHERDVLEAIENLCNTVIANAASRTLAKLKGRTDAKQIFSSTLLLHRALHAISTRRYRFPVRRYIIELFEIKFDGDVLLELAQHDRQAHEELMSGGGLMLTHRHHGHGHHSHGSRRSRHSMRARSRRHSNADFRNQDDAAPETPVVVKPKGDVQKVTGFDAPDSLADALFMRPT